MAINKNLIQSASFNPTKKSYQIPIRKLCEQIENNEIVLPIYQTGIRWTIQKSIDLLNFQLLAKAPVSPISINEIRNEDIAVDQVSFITRSIISENLQGKLSIADGQQRLSCNYKAYTNHPEFRNIILDLAKGKFLLVNEEIKRHQIPAGKLLNKDINVLFKYVENNSYLKKPEVMNILLLIRNKLYDYNYTVNLAEDLTEAEQIEWFEVLNNAGSRISRVQMKFAKLIANGIDIYVDYTDVFKTKLEQTGMDDLFPQKDTEVSIPIAALNPAYEIVNERSHISNYSPIPSDTKESQLCSLPTDKLKKCFDLTLDALDKTIDFIINNNLVLPTRIDYITYIIGLFVYVGNKDLSNIQKDELINWYEHTKFTNKSNPQRRRMFDNLLNLKDI